MLQLTGAGKRFGHKLLFEGLDWLITPKERAGLVGGNGTGKSTLLKVIGGLEQLDYGSISSAIFFLVFLFFFFFVLFVLPFLPLLFSSFSYLFLVLYFSAFTSLFFYF